MKPPCRECQFREVGCHSKCESYIQWRVQLDNTSSKRTYRMMRVNTLEIM